MGVINAVALAAVAAMCVVPSVDAHGWVQKPLARQYCNGDEAMWAIARDGGNGARGMDPPYGGVPGLCGDPFAGDLWKFLPNFESSPCEPQETYEEGGIISMHVDVSANHGGFWEVSICDSKEISQECFDRNKLTTVEQGIEQWHIMYKTIEDPSEKRPESYFMDWKLPEGVSCEHCVLQWSWWTAWSCLYPCDEEVCGFYANLKNDIVRPGATWDYKICETKYPVPGQQPQIFRNCADITITPSVGGTTTSNDTQADVIVPTLATEPTQASVPLETEDTPPMTPTQMPSPEPFNAPANPNPTPADLQQPTVVAASTVEQPEATEEELHPTAPSTRPHEQPVPPRKLTPSPPTPQSVPPATPPPRPAPNQPRTTSVPEESPSVTQENSVDKSLSDSTTVVKEAPTDDNAHSFYSHPFFAFVAKYGWIYPASAPSGSPTTSMTPTSKPTNPSPVHASQEAVPSPALAEQESCTVSRRFLLGEEILEEEDTVNDVSAAGNFMNCGNLQVDQVLIEINHKRKEVHAQPLECSNRAVGICANFSEIMTEQGRKLYESADNCNLAKFRGRCAQIVAVGALGATFTTLPDVDHEVLLDPTYAVAGVGYYEAAGVTYWTMLLG